MDDAQVAKALARTLESITGLLLTAAYLATTRENDGSRAAYFEQVAHTTLAWSNDYWREAITPEDDLFGLVDATPPTVD